MRHAQLVGHAPRVMDVLAGAAGALAADGSTVIVELQRDADDVIARGLHQRGGHRAVDAARHGDDHARGARCLMRRHGEQLRRQPARERCSAKVGDVAGLDHGAEYRDFGPFRQY